MSLIKSTKEVRLAEFSPVERKKSAAGELGAAVFFRLLLLIMWGPFMGYFFVRNILKGSGKRPSSFPAYSREAEEKSGSPE
ncbi:MAG: hypothetical protein HY697_00245 [Deltaproteobacteria bacterium]|nr:hypothetical protein [Deltaproteobacteria bacterium]